MAQLPVPVRAALGLIASVADAIKDGRGLPDGLVEGIADKALELPVLAVSTALQASLRAQQRYAALTVRGDELLSQLRGGPPEEPPAWAQFDDEPGLPPTEPRPSEPVPAAEPELLVEAPIVALVDPPAKRAAKRAPSKRPATKVAPATVTPTPIKARAVPSPRTGRPSAFDRIGGDQP